MFSLRCYPKTKTNMLVATNKSFWHPAGCEASFSQRSLGKSVYCNRSESRSFEKIFTTDFTDSTDGNAFIRVIREIRGSFFGCGFSALCPRCLCAKRMLSWTLMAGHDQTGDCDNFRFPFSAFSGLRYLRLLLFRSERFTEDGSSTRSDSRHSRTFPSTLPIRKSPQRQAKNGGKKIFCSYIFASIFLPFFFRLRPFHPHPPGRNVAGLLPLCCHFCCRLSL